MAINDIAISRKLQAAGMEQKSADAVAEAIVTHSHGHLATKADMVATKADIARFGDNLTGVITRLSDKIESVTRLVQINIALMAGLYILFPVAYIYLYK